MNRKLTLAVVCAATAMLMLDIAVVNTALKPIARDLHAGTGGLKWIVDAYTVVLAAVVLTAGSLGDRFGRRRLFGYGIGLFTVSSVACAAAGSITVLDGARAVQGLGAAIMFAVSLAVLADAFPQGAERRGALAVYGATIGASFAVGPLAGGLLTSGLGWRAIFLVNVPIGLACLIGNRRWVRESRDPAAPRVDVAGQLLLGAGLLLLVLGLLRGNDAGWANPGIVAALAGGGVCVLAFLAVERRVAAPMLPLGLFRRPDFTAAQIVAFGVSATVFAAYLYLTLYLQNVVGLSPIATGVTYLPATFVSFVVAGATASLAERISARTLLVTGLVLSGGGLILMVVSTTAGSGRWAILPGMMVAMAGVGLINPVLSEVALGAVEEAQSGLAAGTLDTFRQAGIALGVAGLGALIPDHADAAAFVSGLHTAMIVAAVITLLSAVAAGVLLGPGRHRALAVAAATAATLGAAGPAADAAPSFRATRMVVSFDVHAVQVTDWRHWTTSGTSWEHADGTQILGWDNPRPIVADVTAYTHMHGIDLPPLVIGPRKLPVAWLTARRTVDWVDHAEYPCDSEGGCADGSTRVQETRPTFTCPRLRVQTTLGFDLGAGPGGGRALGVTFGQLGPLWTSCPPEDLPTANPREVVFAGGVRRLQGLRRGQTVTLKASMDQGNDGDVALLVCPAQLSGDGAKECTTTEVIVRARRLR